MDRHAVALVLDEIGIMHDLLGENQYKARAFFNASRALDEVERDIAGLVRSGELENVRGFGDATVEVVRELVETGESTLHEELKSRTPEGLFALLNVPGLGARRVHTLHAELDVTTLDDLEHAAREGRIAEVKGFGQRTQEKLLEGVEFLRGTAGRRLQPEGWDVAGWLIGSLETHPAVSRIKVAGELRRRMETIDGVDLLVEAEQAAPVLDAFLELPGLRGERVGTAAAKAWLADGLELRLRCVPADGFAAAWVHETGAEAHVTALAGRAEERGLTLNEFGLWQDHARVAVGDEPALYQRVDLAFVVPELREGRGEVEAAAEDALPRLVAYDDLRGAFHCHTTYSDGQNTVAEMAEAARRLGWRFLGLADHSRAAHYAGGLIPDEIARQHEEIDAWNDEHGDELWLFKGIEADILPDGRLDYADAGEDVLESMDYVVASVHSAYEQPKAEKTERVIRALENPHLTMLGHPSGRRLLTREAYPIDLEAVIQAAAERGVAIEINSNPQRLDLDWRYWARAREQGVKTALNPDAHNDEGLGIVEYGVGVARKGGLGPEDVITTWELDEVKKFLQEARSG